MNHAPRAARASNDSGDPAADGGVACGGNANVARFLAQRARSDPGGLGVAAWERDRFESWTWSELEQAAAAVAAGLSRAGVRELDRVCVFVRPSRVWLALVQALFSLGAVPVLIDPGMGRAALLRCVRHIRPRVLIAVPAVHFARWIFRDAFASVELSFSAQTLVRRRGIEAFLNGPARAITPLPRRGDQTAAILFTSGSTGPAKGVVYTHGMFNAQVEQLDALYRFRDGGADLCCFPLFALFGAAFGIASVFPKIDFARPASCDPARIVDAIDRYQTRSSFGSPAIWRRVVPWCEERGRGLGSLTKLMIAGAPVEATLVARARARLPEGGEVFTPYGATEALPVAQVPGRDLIGELARGQAQGGGTCVGFPAPGVEIALCRVTDAGIDRFEPALRVPDGEVGEICVRGENVTAEYAFDEQATSLAKIRDDAGFWHRMGDLGRFDADGRLWFLGRKSQRLETAAGMVCPVPFENVFERHPAIGRCALIGVGPRGSERPVLVVERRSRRTNTPEGTLARELPTWPQAEVLPARLDAVLFRDELPVDPRHQAKIDRNALKAWAEERRR